MTFWAYMLHCRGGAYYVGHTDNLDYRIGQHQSGLIPGYTADRLPVILVWSQDFPTRHEALEAERRIKGWSRAKKMALIRGDWDRISTLAKSKDGPSTSSGRAGLAGGGISKSVCPEPVEGLSFSLIPHPRSPPHLVKAVRVELVESQTDLLLTFHVEGGENMVWPEWRAPERCDGLWQTTCFELFVRTAGTKSYFEFNFSPSTQWAAYRFDDYREGMARLEMPVDPHIERAVEDGRYETQIDLELDFLANEPYIVGLSAIIEEVDGTKSYWALAHPPGAPDFHHPDCFALTLGAPDGI